jgi:hypothetical protein
MTYAQGRTYYDADSHIMELPGLLTDHADPDIRALLPPIRVPRVGKLANLVADAERARTHPPTHVAKLVYEDIGALVRESDERLYLFSSDYPHAEGGRQPLGRFTASLANASESARARFYSENFADLFSLAS